MAFRRRAGESWSAWRIADRRFPIFDGAGAQRYGARWNSPGIPMIYACTSFAGAMLEKLVHAGIGRIPVNQSWVEIRVPGEIEVEEIDPRKLRGWRAEDARVSRAFGDRWAEELRTAVLLVPSVVFIGDRNVLINPQHPAFARITASKPQPVNWDPRLGSAL